MNSRVALQSATRQFRPILSAISQTTIRPALATPHALKTYNLSPIDVYTPTTYIPLVLFFPSSSAFDPSLVNKTNHIERLKHSLAQTLTTYYPFAGRMSSSGSHICCNDHGAQFLEAQVNCSMSEIMENQVNYNNKDDSFGFLFPPGTVWDELNNNSSPLMVIQLNHFDCGGIAMAVSITHKITDGCGLCTFLEHWAAVSSQSGKQVQPYFLSSQSDDSDKPEDNFLPPKTRNVTRRFEFKNSSLTSIRANIAKQGQLENPTRVELLTSLLYRSSIAAASVCDSTFTPSILIHLANVRSQLMIPMTSVGNHYWTYMVEVKKESEATLSLLMRQIRRGKMELRATEASKMNDAKKLIAPPSDYTKNGYKLYICSSLCNFPFHKVDFGWGRPSKVCIAEGACANHLVLTDTADGIEAMVCLEEDQMLMFEKNEEILDAASTTGTNNATGV